MFSLFRKSAPTIDLPTFIAGVADGSVTLIDVREPAEIAANGLAAGALAIPLGALVGKADPASPDHDARLTVDAKIAVYCASGMRSETAKQHLEQLGYTDVTNIGGLKDWQAAGGPITRG